MNALSYNGDIGDILMYDRILTDDERNKVGFYLQWKYGIGGAYNGPGGTVLIIR